MQSSSSIATATETQIWPYHKKVKGHFCLIILPNLVDLESLMLYTKIQPQSFLSTGEEDVKMILPYITKLFYYFKHTL